jgi:hypothetical protein
MLLIVSLAIVTVSRLVCCILYVVSATLRTDILHALDWFASCVNLLAASAGLINLLVVV